MQNIYIILGWGRTGSNWIMNIMCSPKGSPAGICDAVKAESDSKHDVQAAMRICSNVVVHTHNRNIVADLGIDPQNITLIISKRKDLFANIMSHLTATITKEWHLYTNKRIEPVYIAPERFKGWLDVYGSWYKEINTNQPFKHVTTIFYEDVQKDGYIHVMEKLNIPKDAKFVKAPIFGPSPYKYKECIVNWEELYNIYMLS